MPIEGVTSEVFWRAVVDRVGVALTIHNADGGFLWGADQYARVFDLPPGSPVLDGSERLIHPDDFGPLAEAVCKGERARYRLLHPSGRDVWVEATSTDCRTDPEIRGFLVVHRDIDAEVRAQEAVLAMERRQRDIVELSADGFVEWGPDGAAVAANARFLELSGWTLDEVVGHRWFELLPGTGETLARLMGVERPEGRVGPVEVLLRRRDGELIPVLTWAREVPAPAGDGSNWVIVFSDLRGYRRLREEVTAARAETSAAVAQLERVIDAMEDGLYEIDESGTIVFANRRLHEMFDREPGSLLGRHSFEIVHPSERERIAAAYTAAPVVPGHRLTMRGRPNTADGLTRWFQSVSHAVAVDGGMRVVTVLSDVTELEAARAAAVQAERTKSKFVAAVAHELRNPLQPIVAIGDLLTTPGVTPEELAEYAALLERAGTSMLRLVDELVDLERVSLGVMAVEHRPVAVTDLCRTIAAQYRFAAPDQPITVTGPDCDATADAGRVEQVLVGLVANSLRYARTPIEFAVRRAGDQVVIEVADHGSGIPAHLRVRAFEPFDRLDRTDREGAGLGLAVAKRLVAAMHGTIELADTPGGGLTVVVGLPAV
jgi:PAS domain S-box-containing protein